MRGWERVRTGVTCAYGCAIGHMEWAWWGKYPMVCCEPCAGKYGISRPPVLVASNSDAPVPATPEPEKFVSMADLAAKFGKSPTSVERAISKVRARRPR